MEPIKNQGYIVLVGRLPSPDDVDRNALLRSAYAILEKIPSLSQSRIVTADSKFERETAEVLKEAWNLPSESDQIAFNDLFLSRTFQDNPKKFSEGIKKYLGAQNNQESPFVIIGSAITLHAILDILEIPKGGIRWTINAWVVVVEINDNSIVAIE